MGSSVIVASIVVTADLVASASLGFRVGVYENSVIPDGGTREGGLGISMKRIRPKGVFDDVMMTVARCIRGIRSPEGFPVPWRPKRAKGGLSWET